MPGVLDPHAVAVGVLDELRDAVWVTDDVEVRD